MMAYGLTHDDHARIQAAVKAADSRANGHIAFVAVPASDRYALYPIVWAALIAIVALGVLAFVPFHVSVRQGFAAEAVLFVLLSLFFEWRPLKMLLVPVHHRHAHAKTLAHREFAARILAGPERRGGVLIFVSLGERYAELLADGAAHHRVGQESWDKILSDFTATAKPGRLADAAVAAIEVCGNALEAHPPR
jgi:putative membrane protein